VNLWQQEIRRTQVSTKTCGINVFTAFNAQFWVAIMLKSSYVSQNLHMSFQVFVRFWIFIYLFIGWSPSKHVNVLLACPVVL
jgi:hypothetical protein